MVVEAMDTLSIQTLPPIAAFSTRLTSSIPQSSTRFRLVVIAASPGKGFGELLKQKKPETATEDGPVLRSKGFGSRAQKKSKKSSSIRVEEDDKNDLNAVCPCGGGDDKLDYDRCCMPYHRGTLQASDGLTLLKTRYSAYALGVVGYIAETTHPDNPDSSDDLLANIQATCDNLKFYKLEILDNEVISDKESTVSFQAVYGPRQGGRGERNALEEKSYFVLEDDKWLFRDGIPLNQVSQAAWTLSSKAN